MSAIAESALYGELVQYLRDHWAIQRAEHHDSSVDEERTALDAMIQAWFFRPQKALHGLTPRDVIRNEQMGRPNVVPPDRLPDMLGEDYDLMRESFPDENMSEWYFGLAPDRCLLDDYDPEGYDLRWSTSDDAEATDPEAHAWLASNPSDHALAIKRFGTTGLALDFVRRLYKLGAEDVRVGNVCNDIERIQRDNGPYADMLIVKLPKDAESRTNLYDVFVYEMQDGQGLELAEFERADELILWWQ